MEEQTKPKSIYYSISHSIYYSLLPGGRREGSHQYTKGVRRMLRRPGRQVGKVLSGMRRTARLARTIVFGLLGMISIGKVRDPDYYLQELHQDDAYEYYGSLERSGQWHGTFAEELGLTGQIDPEDFTAILEGKRPGTETPLTEFPIRMPALDVTLSVQKEVSLLWGLGDHETRQHIENALDNAESSVIAFLEAEAIVVRRGHGGLQYHPGSGSAVASFSHHTSRLGDPNLHRHLIFVNASPGPDGRITGIDTRQIYGSRYTAEAVFQASLRHELAQSLGLVFGEVDRHGVAPVAGVPKTAVRGYSQRRRAIETEMDNRGVTTGRGARVAALASRPNKEQDLPDNVLRVQWRQRAEELGFSIAEIPTLVRTPELTTTDEQLAFAATEYDSTYTRRDLIRHVARSAENGATLDQIMTKAEEYLEGSHAIERLPGVYTTPEILELETRAASAAMGGLDQNIGVASQQSVDEALATRPHLADEQRHLVAGATRSGDAITVVVGKAGAGKTTTLDALRDAYERDGHRVLGGALSARAAAELSSGAGIKSQTIHRTITQLSTNSLRLDDKTVLVIDEAGMVGTRHLAQLIDEASRANAKLVLVGDPRQLPEVDAGGTFSAIGRRIEPLQLTENRRQVDPNERAALDALRTDRVDVALDSLQRSGRVTVGDNSHVVRTALVDDWLQARDSGSDALMVAARRSDVADLNDRGRQRLIENGELGPAIWRNDYTEFSLGDRVVAHRNAYDIGILNGNQGSVTGTTASGLTIRTDEGKTVHVPNEYIDEGQLTHGYALTVHKAQGMTVDAAFLLGDDALFNELGYTGLSRGRHENHLYSVVSRNEMGQAAADPLADVRRALGQSRAKTAAIDIGGPSLT